jgi:hypothetical protein
LNRFEGGTQSDDVEVTFDRRRTGDEDSHQCLLALCCQSGLVRDVQHPEAAVHGIGIALLPGQMISVPLKERLTYLHVAHMGDEVLLRKIRSIWRACSAYRDACIGNFGILMVYKASRTSIL